MDDALLLDDPSGITPEWITRALGLSPAHAVATVDVTPVGTGQMGSSHRVRFDRPVDRVGSSVVVKLPSADPAVRTMVATSYGTEAAFYRDLGRRLPIRVPTCHLAVTADGGQRSTLVLEDLAPARQGDQLAGSSVPDLIAAAENLAGLAAGVPDPPGWLATLDEDGAEFLGALVTDAVGPLIERLGDAVDDDSAATLRRSAADVAPMLAAHRERWSLVHGDYRLDNLMFHPDGEVAAVDWQTVSAGLPGRDLAYLVATSLDPGDRREAERDVVEAHRRRTEQLTGRDVDPAQSWDDYVVGLPQVTLVVVLGATYGATTARGDEMFATMIRRGAAALADHRG